MLKTQKEIREAFWNEFSELYGNEYKVRKRQNEYSTDCRSSFVDFVGRLQKEGLISEKLANKVIL